MWEENLGREIRKGVVVHHGMDAPEEYNVVEEYPEKAEGVIDVVCVGLFYRWKGQLALIETWPEVLAACKVPLRLIFVGGGACLDEAMARGRPVIAPAHGGAVEIVVDGETGYLVQTADCRPQITDLNEPQRHKGAWRVDCGE